MALSAEAVIAIVGIVVSLPSLFLLLYKLIRDRNPPTAPASIESLASLESEITRYDETVS